MITNFTTLEAKLNEEVLERNEEVHTAILALVAKRHHFQVGPPGTAKSLLVSRLATKIDDLPEHGYFHYLLTQFTVPGELYGPPNLQDMRDKGIYRLNTTGKLPQAHIAFLDEIFKGNSSILNANLTIMNERKFFNADDDPNIPLITMFAASNEMPQGDNLNALWDRLHFRHEIRPLQEASSFMKMLESGKLGDDKFISINDIVTAQNESALLPISKNCMEAIKGLREAMEKEGLSATERRWMDCIPIIRAEAWLNDREVVDVDCLRPLMHVLWSELNDRGKVQRLILEIANPLDKEAQELLDRLVKLHKDMTEGLKGTPDPKQVVKLGVEFHSKLNQGKTKYDALKAKQDASGVSSLVLPRVHNQLTASTKILIEDIFGYDSATKTPKL